MPTKSKETIGIFYLFNARAHVYHINPETKNSWILKGDSAISLIRESQQEQEFNDESSRSGLKLIGVCEDGSEVLNVPIHSKTVFTKQSPEFGQLTDCHTGKLYGIAFASEKTLSEFIKTFLQAQRNTIHTEDGLQNLHQLLPARATPSQALDQSMNLRGVARNNLSETDIRLPTNDRTSAFDSRSQLSSNAQLASLHPREIFERDQRVSSNSSLIGNSDIFRSGLEKNQRSSSRAHQHPVIGHQVLKGGLPNKTSIELDSKSGSRSTIDLDCPISTSSDIQMRDHLKYENKLLKQSLEESSKNASIWHDELVTLRTNNDKLTRALEETKAHVEEWERELMASRNENEELRLRIKAIESSSDNDKLNEYKSMLQKLSSREHETEVKLDEKDRQIEELERSLEELRLKSHNGLEKSGDSGEAKISNGKSVVVLDEHKRKFESLFEELDIKNQEFAKLGKELSRLFGELRQQTECDN